MINFTLASVHYPWCLMHILPGSISQFVPAMSMHIMNNLHINILVTIKVILGIVNLFYVTGEANCNQSGNSVSPARVKYIWVIQRKCVDRPLECITVVVWI